MGVAASPSAAPATLAAAVAAWHNRHPLAQRIVPSQVHGLGVLDLPMAAPMPPARGPARLLCGTDALYHLDPGMLTRWLARVGPCSPEALPAGLPRRRLDASAMAAAQAERDGFGERRFATVLTAAVDIDGKRLRLLVSPGPRPRVLGSRAWSLPRLGAAAVLSLTLGAGVALAWTAASPPPGPSAERQATAPRPAAGPSTPAPPSTQAAAAPEASATASASAATARGASAPAVDGPPPAKVQPEPARVTAVVAPAPVPQLRVAAAPPPVAAAPDSAASASPEQGDPGFALAPIRAALVPPLDPAQRIALREQARALRTAAAAAPVGSIGPVDSAQPAATADRPSPDVRRSAPMPTPAPRGQAWALVTPALASRDAAQAQLVMLRSLVAQAPRTTLTRLDLMPGDDGWRVTWWPHPSREAAVAKAEAARAHGVQLEAIAF